MSTDASESTSEIDKPIKLSAVEKIKDDSNYLLGTIDVELTEASDHFNDQNLQLLKFHGTYQQDDRDVRAERKKLAEAKRTQ